MAKKMGRPPLPNGKAKGKVFSVKLSAEDTQKLSDNIHRSEQSRADYGREALMLRAVPMWIVSERWGYDDLQGKTVEYDFRAQDGSSYAKGPGRFWVFKHNDKVHLAIEIHGASDSNQFMRIFLTQELADSIQPHPNVSVADFCCFSVVKGLKRLD